MPRCRLRRSSSTSRAMPLLRPAHPDAERHRESHLLAREDLARQHVAHGLAQHPLGREPSQLQAAAAGAPRTRRADDRETARGSRSRPPCSSGPASSAARRGRSSGRRRARDSTAVLFPFGRVELGSRRLRRRGAAAIDEPRVAAGRPARRPIAGEVVEEHRSRACAATPGTTGWRSARCAPGSRGTTTCRAHELRTRSGASARTLHRPRQFSEGAWVLAVAGEQLVAAFTGQHHLHVLAERAPRRSRAARSTGGRSARPRARPAAAARRRNPLRR